MPAAHADARLRPLASIARRLADIPAAPWSPPPLPELIARIDHALAARRAG